MLGKTFAAIFKDSAATKQLAALAGVSHTVLPTFALTTTSLRHLPKWFDRLEEIEAGSIKSHGNFITDPAAIGLVVNTKSGPILSPIGTSFLSKKPSLYQEPAKAEYELLKLLYFSGVAHTPDVRAFLNNKRSHMSKMLQEFTPAPNLGLLISYPSLLVIAELIAPFPGAIARLVLNSQKELVELATLTEAGMKSLGAGPGLPDGLDRLCQRIAGNFRRAQERRLHFLVSMCLLTIASQTPAASAVELKIPFPYGNLFSAVELHKLHAQYTQDITIWFDGSKFLISSTKHFTSIASGPTPPIKVIAFKPLVALPSGKGAASPSSAKRSGRRSASGAPVTIVIDQVLSEHAEDFVERTIMIPKFGNDYVRAGHRNGETLALPDDMVPGADFYAIDRLGTPTLFVEVKSTISAPPCDVTLTRAEYFRARDCAKIGIPYWLILVNVTDGKLWKVDNFADAMHSAELQHVLQFVIKIVLA